MKTGKIKVKILLGFVLTLLTVMFLTTNAYAADIEYDTSDRVYLSDISYVTDMSYIENGNSFHFDTDASNKAISLKYEDEVKIFQKGISAWATSNLVYDLSDYSYDKFTAYIGVSANQTSDYANDGAVITVYTSVDGENWTVAYKSGAKKGFLNSDHVEVSVKGAKYLRLYAYCNGANWWSPWYDDVLYADAKLVKDGFVENNEPNDLIHTLDWYDKYLRQHDSNDANYENYLLQRELVKNVGYDALQSFLKFNPKSIGTGVKWLFEDKEALSYYIMGGVPDGTYRRSFEVMSDLLHKYKSDMDIKDVTENGVVLGDLYKRMIVTLSLTHSAPVGTWITGAPQDPNHPNGSNAVNRYFIYRKMHKKDLLENKIFENLTVEEMRMVMNNIISDEEIEWLNYYSKTKGKGAMNPYSYIDYSFGYNYQEEQYYDPALKDHWTELYNLDGKQWGEDWDLTFTPTYGYTKLWIVFEENSVCGGIAKTGVSLQVAYGVPASVVGQPGHAAYIYMSLNSKGEKEWVLGNDVSGWAQSGRTEKLSIRLPLGWGTDKASSGYVVSYFPLIQAAFDDYEGYKQAEEYIMLANVYKDDFATAESYYRKAIKAQAFHFKAWVGLIDLYKAYDKPDSDFVNLISEFVPIFTYYPLPMDNLLNYAGQYIKSEGNTFYLYSIRTNALLAAKNATAENSRQPNITKAVARYLAGDVEKGIVEFTFDGYVNTPTGVVARKDENGQLYAGYILLAEKFKGNEIYWQYMINGRDWKDASGIAHKLTDAELATISAETGVKVRILGALDIVYTVDITTGTLPNIYGNDLENTIFGIDSTAIDYWNFETGQWENALFGLYFDWDTFEMREPIFKGNQTVYFRRAATMTTTASDVLEVVFTQDNTDPNHSYITRNHLKVHDYPSMDPDATFDQAINGDIGNFWRTKTAETNVSRRYFTIALDAPVYLSALQYVPRQSGVSGIVTNAKIQVSMDGSTWTTVVASTNWEENAQAKYVEFEKPVQAKYVKIIGTETSDDYMSAALINLFEDTTAAIPPKGTVEYSTTTLTNQNVTAILHTDKYVEIKDEKVTKQPDGTFTYEFDSNRSYTFEFTDAFGNKGTAEAKVEWIDKDPPKATVEYSTKDPTSGSVIATLKCEEPITITNNDGRDTYTFSTNGSFTFKYKDAAGNEAETEASVNWIQTEAPNISLKYDIEQPTNQPVTVTVVSDTKFEITSNDKSESHTFDDNGEWTFVYKAGAYTGSLTARVTWIDKEPPKVSVEYSADTNKPTNQPIIATLISNEPIIIEGLEPNDDGHYYHTFTKNGDFVFAYRDLAGNTGKVTAAVSCIDTTPPEANVVYSKTTLTNESVIATLVSEEDITIISNNGSSVRLFDKNGSFEFVYTDEAGNVGRTTAQVTWIDKQAPIGRIQYSRTESGAGPVVATLVCDNEPIIVTNNDGKPTYTFYKNGRFEFIYRDEAGNVATIYAEVSWITDQTAWVEYSTTDMTNTDVTATLCSDADIVVKELEGVEQDESGNYYHTFTQNGDFTFVYTDQSGEEESVTASVNWIDRDLPKFEVQYDHAPNIPTNQSVTVTLVSDEDIMMVSDFSNSVYGRVFTYVFDKNDVLTLIYHDRAGNSGVYELAVSWIDKDSPIGSIIYSSTEPGPGPVTATLTANEDITIDNNGGSDEFTFNYNGTFEFQYHDKAGNTGSTVADVYWITPREEDHPPVITIEKDNFYFDLCTDLPVDLSYFINLITITDDKDIIDINNTKQVQIDSDFKWEKGTYTITVTVTDSGENTATLVINIIVDDTSVDFGALSFELAGDKFVYNGYQHLPTVTVRNNSEILVLGTDYTATYTNNINAGEATVLLTGFGRYKGYKTLTFTIEKAQPAPEAFPGDIIEVSYDIDIAEKVLLPVGWTWKDPNKALTVGENSLQAVYIVDDNYETLEKTVTVKRLEDIIPNQPPVITLKQSEFIFDRRVSYGIDIFAYLKDFVTVEDDRDGIIDPNDEEHVEFSIDSEFDWAVGEYTVTVTAKDSSKAISSAEIKINIVDSTVYIEALSVELETDEVVFNGNPQAPAVTVKNGDVVLTEGEHYNLVYDNNVNVGQASVTVIGLGVYSGSRTLTFTIREPMVSVVPDGDGSVTQGANIVFHDSTDNVVYGQTLTFEVNVKPGYRLVSVNVNGEELYENNGIYEITVTDDLQIAVKTELIKYTVKCVDIKRGNVFEDMTVDVESNEVIINGTEMTVSLSTFDITDEYFDFVGWVSEECNVSEDNKTIAVDLTSSETVISLTAQWKINREALEKLLMSVSLVPEYILNDNGTYTMVLTLNWNCNSDLKEIYGEELENAELLATGFTYARVNFQIDDLKDEIKGLDYSMNFTDPYKWLTAASTDESRKNDLYFYYCVWGEAYRRFSVISDGKATFQMSNIKADAKRYASIFLSLKIDGEVYVITGKNYTFGMQEVQESTV
ncbi:MAG: discoidin domain-containing protein [Oscillospiraceae bacterium]|nr:discoidin domain-containing protein [Oscillospiraceae bacterium]